MTPCEELGYKVGQRFREVGDGWFLPGTILTLIDDDGTTMPRFKGDLAEPTALYVELDSVRPIYRVRAGTSEVIDV